LTRFAFIVVISILTLGCQVQGGIRAGTHGTLPADLAQFGELRLATTEEARDAISADRAVQQAGEAGYQWPGQPSTYLVMATALTPAELPDDSRLVWLVRWEKIELEDPPPPAASGFEAEPRPPLQYAYVFLDARTGEFIKARLAE
jgi:hypothetical protein